MGVKVPLGRALESEIKELDVVMHDLQILWENNEAVLTKYRGAVRGMKSSQVACIVLYLKRRGVIYGKNE